MLRRRNFRHPKWLGPLKVLFLRSLLRLLCPQNQTEQNKKRTSLDCKTCPVIAHGNPTCEKASENMYKNATFYFSGLFWGECGIRLTALSTVLLKISTKFRWNIYFCTYKVQLVTKEVVQYYLMGQCHKLFDFSLFVNRNHLKQGIIDFLFLFW